MSDDKKGKVVGLKVSRMDPMDTYDASALAEQLAEALNSACSSTKTQGRMQKKLRR
jgi:hypothetical protein